MPSESTLAPRRISLKEFLLFVVLYILIILKGFPGGSDGKESACNTGDLGSIPGLGRSPRKGDGNPLQYSYLENPMDRRDCQALVHRVAKSQT